MTRFLWFCFSTLSQLILNQTKQLKFRPSTLIHRFNSTSFTWTVWELEPFWCIVFWGLKVVSWPGKLCSLMIIINHYLQSTFLQVLWFLHFKKLKNFFHHCFSTFPFSSIMLLHTDTRPCTLHHPPYVLHYDNLGWNSTGMALSAAINPHYPQSNTSMSLNDP